MMMMERSKMPITTPRVALQPTSQGGWGWPRRGCVMVVVFDVEPDAVAVAERLEAVAVGLVLEVVEVEWNMMGGGGT